MGAGVNGPGESEHADIGLSGGGGVGVIYRKGRQVRRGAEAQMVDALIEEVKHILGEGSGFGVRGSGQEPQPVHAA